MTGGVHDPVALRLQRLDLQLQALVLGQLAASRSDDGSFSPGAVLQSFHDFALPAPAKVGNVFTALTKKKWLAKQPQRAAYKVTPAGQAKVREQMADLDLVALVAESAHKNAPVFGRTEHALVPVHLAPPALVRPLQSFQADHPFDTNVFGMTRFPDAKAGTADPVGRALAIVREVCAESGLEFHLASDRAIVDDLWDNVTAHMWACRYGVAFFEDRVDRGLNHNLLIEVGAMIMSGRRCALLKDGSIEKLPTDFVGMIYKSVDLSVDGRAGRAHLDQGRPHRRESLGSARRSRTGAARARRGIGCSEASQQFGCQRLGAPAVPLRSTTWRVTII